jgi:ribosomal protein S17
MRSLAAVLALGIAFSATPFLPVAHAGQAHAQKVQAKKRTVKGTVSSVDGETVVVSVTSKKTGATKDRKIKTDDKTKVTVDGKEAKLSDLKAGQQVVITPGEEKGAPASEIAATSAADNGKASEKSSK